MEDARRLGWPPLPRERAGVRGKGLKTRCQILSQMPSTPFTNIYHRLSYDSLRSIFRHSVCIHEVHRSATPPRSARIAV